MQRALYQRKGEAEQAALTCGATKGLMFHSVTETDEAGGQGGSPE